MGKLTDPSARVAVPSTPGARPSDVSAPVKPASSLTDVLLPVRVLICATGFLSSLELPLLLQAATVVAKVAATASPITTFSVLCIVVLLLPRGVANEFEVVVRIGSHFIGQISINVVTPIRDYGWRRRRLLV